MRKYNMQEKIDAATLNCLLYGTGFIKTIWDKDGGDVESFDEATGEVEMTGDITITAPSPYHIYLDPDAECWEEVRWLFEARWISYEDACAMWPEKKEILKTIREESGTGTDVARQTGDTVYGYGQANRAKFDAVKVWEYWEKGLPSNGMLGRYCVCTQSGDILDELRPNPFRFEDPEQDVEGNKKTTTTAGLPYHIITDVDVPHEVWGKSFTEFEAPLQTILNRIDSMYLENLQAHGVARLILPEGAEIMDDAITNSPWDIIKIAGHGNMNNIHFAAPMQLPPAMSEYRDRIKVGIDDLAGVNESMFGQQSREQSGFSMQYATNQGNMIRRRLFNKYVLFVESTYKAYLNLVRKHWTVPRTIQVLGKENAFLTMDIEGSDIDGGFDLVVEYGTSLSLDPMTRREEIMTLQPLFKEAGVPTRQLLGMLKLSELGPLYDMMKLAETRQREIFEKIIATGRQVEPEKYQDHKGMLAYALRYVMTTEFNQLEDDEKELIREHIDLRRQQEVEETQVPQQPGAPGPSPDGAGPAAAGGMPGAGAPAAPGPEGENPLAALMGGGAPAPQ
jgi:hypothetical protein